MRQFNPKVDDYNWKCLFETHFQNMQSLNAISTMWMMGFSKLGIDNNRRPKAEDLTKAVAPNTGFQFIQTDQNIILEQIDWYQFIARRQMPMTTFLRTPQELDYCDEPDIWHDIMGHVPFLAVEEYAEMYMYLAQTYISAYQNGRSELLKELDFIGGLLIELGLIRESSGIKAFGSTFYSSSEVFEAFKPENQVPFTLKNLSSGESYDRHSFQGRYYIFEGMDPLNKAIEHVAKRL